jgi:hypothetical protein
MELRLDIPAEDADYIVAIVERAERAGCVDKTDRMRHLLDLTVCHANGTSLDLAAMLTGPILDVDHDLTGLRRHMNRRTGAMEDLFQPRFAVQAQALEWPWVLVERAGEDEQRVVDQKKSFLEAARARQPGQQVMRVLEDGSLTTEY